MGDRVVVTFTEDGETYTPGIYLHWGGRHVRAMLRASAPEMSKGDADISAAVFFGHCAALVERAYGDLILFNAPDGKDWEAYSKGDEGVYVVDVRTGLVRVVCGDGDGFRLNLGVAGA